MIHLLRSVYRSLLELMREHEKLQRLYDRVLNEIGALRQENVYLSKENDRLEGVERDFEQVREVLGDRAVDEAIYAERQTAQLDRKKIRSKNQMSL